MSAIIRHLYSIGWHKLLGAFLIVWFVVFMLTAFPTTHFNAVDTKTAERLSKALADLEALQRQNIELHEIFKELSVNNFKGDQKEAIANFQTRLTKVEHSSSLLQKDIDYVKEKEEPNTQYELLRRRVASNTKEFWYFIYNGLMELQKTAGFSDLSQSGIDIITRLLKLGAEHHRSLVHDIEKLPEVDGYAAWREREANELSNLVQARLHYLQHPPNCDKAKKIVCNINKGCGYGCQLHHMVYCFLVAYGTERTLIMQSTGWRYHKSGWEDIFQPISNSCVSGNGESVRNWPGDAQVLKLPIIDSLSPRPPFLPLAIPEDLAPRLIRLHGDPIVWWIGQILKYLLKPQKKTAERIQEAMTRLGFKRPIVGVHIRRTDKVGTEAAYHGIEEYMGHVDEYFNQLEMKQHVDKRRIYLASDDPKVIQDAKNKYPHYDVLGDSSISKTASVSTRYSDSSLFGIIFDIHMLSMSDFLVCTFSSQVCRVAYEIMQNYYPDAADRFRSLDDIYYYGGQNAHNVVAVLPHEPMRNGEISMLEGDVVGVAGNHWNGYSKGKNTRTSQIGLYPSFKVKNKVETASFPTYPEVNQQD